MEYAAGGELFNRISSRIRFSEPEARYFFQQLVCGLDHCHRMVRAIIRGAVGINPGSETHVSLWDICCLNAWAWGIRQLCYG